VPPMNRLQSARRGFWVGVITGIGAGVVVGVVIVDNAPPGPQESQAIITSVLIGLLLVPVGAVVGAVVGFLFGERPHRPRDTDEAYSPVE
jgi:hypothetical protein